MSHPETNTDGHLQKDLTNEDGTASNVILEAFVEVELEELKDVAISGLSVVLDHTDLTEEEAIQHVENVFKFYSAMARFLILSNAETDSSFDLIRDFSRVILVEQAAQLNMEYEEVEQLMRKVVDSAIELAAEFITSDKFREYRDSLPVE